MSLSAFRHVLIPSRFRSPWYLATDNGEEMFFQRDCTEDGGSTGEVYLAFSALDGNFLLRDSVYTYQI